MLNIKRRIQLNNALISFGLVFGLGTAMAAGQVNTGGKINITGKVTPTTCVISNGINRNITLPELRLSQVFAYPVLDPSVPVVSTTATAIEIPITFTGCTRMTKVSIKGSGHNSALENTGGAIGVTLGLAQKNNMTGLTQNNGMSLNLEPDGGDGNYKVTGLVVDYVRLNATTVPTAGDIKAMAEIVVTLGL